jgi:hypothetical protein
VRVLGCVVPLTDDQDRFCRVWVAPGVGDGDVLGLIVVAAVDAVAFQWVFGCPWENIE